MFLKNSCFNFKRFLFVLVYLDLLYPRYGSQAFVKVDFLHFSLLRYLYKINK